MAHLVKITACKGITHRQYRCMTTATTEKVTFEEVQELVGRDLEELDGETTFEDVQELVGRDLEELDQ
jgi:hypothetical protein